MTPERFAELKALTQRVGIVPSAKSPEFGLISAAPEMLAEIERLQRIEACVRSIAKNVHGTLREDLDDALRGMAANK